MRNMRDYTELFKTLNKSETGKWLIDYLEDMLVDLCDVRKGDMTNEVRLKVEEIIRDRVIDKILLTSSRNNENNEPDTYD